MPHPTFPIRPIAFALVAPMLIGIFTPLTAQAETKKIATTTVTVGEMCGGCVKRITARFKEEKKVAKIECSIADKTVVLTPAKNARLSAVVVWDIFEGIGKKPVKMVSPEGTFTAKPKTKRSH